MTKLFNDPNSRRLMLRTARTLADKLRKTGAEVQISNSGNTVRVFGRPSELSGCRYIRKGDQIERRSYQ